MGGRCGLKIFLILTMIVQLYGSPIELNPFRTDVVRDVMNRVGATGTGENDLLKDFQMTGTTNSKTVQFPDGSSAKLSVSSYSSHAPGLLVTPGMKILPMMMTAFLLIRAFPL